ncbi:MAG: FAD-dependent oxidoreductase [Porticoccaceae bacterium]|nr:FAD-dependent oxidoreductase [Porticoccaceae bacterium]
MSTSTQIDTGAGDPVVVIGGGLAGLYAAWRLTQVGVNVVLVEAQQRLGGRILSEPLPGLAPPVSTAYDLGPTWYWPALQTRLPQLIHQLGLHVFEQPADGAVLFESSPDQTERVAYSPAMAGSMRLHGGMARLITALASHIDPSRIRLGHRVVGLHLVDDVLELDVATGDEGPSVQLRATRVVCTLPPRLLARSVSFAPPLPDAIIDNWLAVPTWMAAHAKFVAVFERAFWCDAGLSGQAQSRVGPLVEIHDATEPGGQPALFGFFGVPVEARRTAGTQLHEAALAQLQRLFGPAAAKPLHTFYKDWVDDAFIATRDDETAPLSHPAYGAHTALPGRWKDRLWLAGTESAREHGGYLEGALEAAEVAVQELLAQLPTAAC